MGMKYFKYLDRFDPKFYFVNFLLSSMLQEYELNIFGYEFPFYSIIAQRFHQVRKETA